MPQVQTLAIIPESRCFSSSLLLDSHYCSDGWCSFLVPTGALKCKRSSSKIHLLLGLINIFICFFFSLISKSSLKSRCIKRHLHFWMWFLILVRHLWKNLIASFTGFVQFGALKVKVELAFETKHLKQRLWWGGSSHSGTRIALFTNIVLSSCFLNHFVLISPSLLTLNTSPAFILSSTTAYSVPFNQNRRIWENSFTY